jgi:hypothetical protein
MKWLRELGATINTITKNLERDNRLRLYGDPRVVEDLGIAAAQAGMTVEEVEAAANVYRRAQWFNLDRADTIALANARMLIDDRPHTPSCRRSTISDAPCNCWKQSVS